MRVAQQPVLLPETLRIVAWYLGGEGHFFAVDPERPRIPRVWPAEEDERRMLQDLNAMTAVCRDWHAAVTPMHWTEAVWDLIEPGVVQCPPAGISAHELLNFHFRWDGYDRVMQGDYSVWPTEQLRRAPFPSTSIEQELDCQELFVMLEGARRHRIDTRHLSSALIGPARTPFTCFVISHPRRRRTYVPFWEVLHCSDAPLLAARTTWPELKRHVTRVIMGADKVHAFDATDTEAITSFDLSTCAIVDISSFPTNIWKHPAEELHVISANIYLAEFIDYDRRLTRWALSDGPARYDAMHEMELAIRTPIPCDTLISGIQYHYH